MNYMYSNFLVDKGDIIVEQDTSMQDCRPKPNHKESQISKISSNFFRTEQVKQEKYFNMERNEIERSNGIKIRNRRTTNLIRRLIYIQQKLKGMP